VTLPTDDAAQPVIQRLEDFDRTSGSWAERLFFNHRPWVLLLCLAATLLLGWQALGIGLTASFDKTIPSKHPYIVNFIEHKGKLAGGGNALRIAVQARNGSIFDKDYLEALRKINDELFLMPGVDRPFMKSLWTSNTRWVAVTEEGLDGDTVMSDRYDGSDQSLAEVRANVERSGEIGQLVATDFGSSIVYVPLLDKDPRTGAPLDYGALGQQLEELRARYSDERTGVHIIGFAKVMGDLIEGVREVLGFFALAILICAAVLFAYTRCVRSTAIVVACSLIAVVWQLGLLRLLGQALDPYSVLVPFLVFAIGMSHGAQKMNGILQDVGRGTHRVVAARYTFRRLFVAGLTALLCDAVGFAVLALIDIRVIQDLATNASIGVAVLIFTNLVLLPVLLSYVGVSPAAAQRSLKQEQASELRGAWALLASFTQARPALAACVAAGLLLALSLAVASHIQVGDLDAGAPELRADSRYNRDNAFVVQHYAASTDILTVMATTPDDQCTRYANLSRVDALAWRLQQLPGVEGTQSMAGLTKLAMVGFNEGHFKWYELIANDKALGGVQAIAPRELFNKACSFLALHVFLKDHKAQTLERVVADTEAFIAEQPPGDTRFMLAAGSAGIEAATNIVVKRAMREMLLWVYGAVILLCWITFRSWRATLAAVLPLVLTSVLCEALMVLLGMGVKVATLPVIALGVGIGVDYALYVLAVMLQRLERGDTVDAAYRAALQFTGRVVLLTGLTLALAVGTWYFSPIKFQADMGILLAFMFLWNMVGALVLLPALARWLLRPAARVPKAAGLQAGALALVLVLAVVAAPTEAVAQQAAAPIVVGQSLPMTGPAFPIANRVRAGAQTLVERINAAGGIHGRRLELATLDDGGDPARVGANVRAFARMGAVAVANCIDEAACAAAAAATREHGLVLVGPYSGAAALRAAPHVYSVRPDDQREADALVRQLRSMAVERVVLRVDGHEPSHEQALAVALQAGAMQSQRVAVAPQTLDDAMRAVSQARPQAVVAALGPSTLDALSRRSGVEGLPPFIAATSSAWLTQLTRLFRERVVGYTSVVPNPETSQLPIVREFERDADAAGGPEAITFEGMASYLHLRVLTEALRRAHPKVDGARLGKALEEIGTLSLGGFVVRYDAEHRHGSDATEVGLRTRDGRLRR
jgi:hypothetical protein